MPAMRAYYIECLVKMNAHATNLTSYKRKLLLIALRDGAADKKLTQEYYHKLTNQGVLFLS